MADKLPFFAAESGTWRTTSPDPHIDLSGTALTLGTYPAQTFKAAADDATLDFATTNTCTITAWKDASNWKRYEGAVWADAATDTLDLSAATLMGAAGSIANGDAVSVVAGLPAQPAASQAEMETGTESAIRSMSPLRVAQAIAKLAPFFAATAFPTPAAGMLCYRTDQKILYMYEGAWNPIFGFQATTYYVRTDGSDSNTGLADTAGGAFLTIQKAIDVATSCDFLTNAVTISVADGTYAGVSGSDNVVLKTIKGTGAYTIQGNTTTPANVVVSTSGATSLQACFGSSSIRFVGSWFIKGVIMQSTGSNQPVGILASNAGAIINFESVIFGSGLSRQIRTSDGGLCIASGNYTITHGAWRHIDQAGGVVRVQAKTITISNTPEFLDSFVGLQRISMCHINGCTFSGSATGPRYLVKELSQISTDGGGANYLPGDSAGTTDAATFGLYT